MARIMLQQALDDPEMALLLRRALTGPVLPFVAGTSNTDYIMKDDGSGSAIDTVTPIFEDATNKRIGIGTASPAANLHVFTGGSTVILGESSASDTQFYLLTTGTGGRGWKIQTGNDASGLDGVLRVLDNTAGQERLRIDTAGKVGIGTGSPASLLHISAASQAALRVEATSGDAQINFQASGSGGRTWLFQTGDTGSGLSGRFRIQDSTAGQERLTIDTSGNVGIGTSSPAQKLSVVEGSDKLLESGLNSGITDQGGNTAQVANQLYSVGLGGKTESAALYIKVDPGTSQKFGILGDIVSQTDGYGGFLKIAHNGGGDAIFVPLLADGGVALEAASNHDGTRGIIFTVQTQTSNPSYGDITLFTALWEQATLPNYGMFYADQAPGNALTIRKRVAGVSETDPQIRVWDFDAGNSIDRNRFEVLNDGTLRASGPKATSGTQTQDSPPLTLRGAYWTGSASADLDWKVRNDVTGSNASRLKVQDPSNADMFMVLDNGDICVPTGGQGIILKSPNGTCYRVTITDGGALTVSSPITCP